MRFISSFVLVASVISLAKGETCQQICSSVRECRGVGSYCKVSNVDEVRGACLGLHYRPENGQPCMYGRDETCPSDHPIYCDPGTGEAMMAVRRSVVEAPPLDASAGLESMTNEEIKTRLEQEAEVKFVRYVQIARLRAQLIQQLLGEAKKEIDDGEHLGGLVCYDESAANCEDSDDEEAEVAKLVGDYAGGLMNYQIYARLKQEMTVRNEVIARLKRQMTADNNE